MFGFLKRRPAPVANAVVSIPDDTVVWAIGDVHGRLDLLRPLVSAIEADLDAGDAKNKLVIFLGDYIDRGAQSRGVLEYLEKLHGRNDVEYRFLKGNHEETMLRFLDDPSVGTQWCEYGGVETLASYGLTPPARLHSLQAWASVSADLVHAVGDPGRAFLESLELSVTVGGYFFAHAGANPEKALDRQSARDLMWIRRSFLDSEVRFEKMVVHGHTPTAVVHADDRRIGIDTRAYDSGVLTALRLEGEARAIMQAVGPSGGAIVDGGSGTSEVRIKMTGMPDVADLLEIGT